MNTVYKSIISVLCIFTILCVVFTAVANADDKANSANVENAVVVPQKDNLTPAQKFFKDMSPEEFRDPVAMDDFISRFPDSPEANAVFAIRYSLLERFPTIEGYNDFIKKYPGRLQTQIAIQKVFDLYCNQNCAAGYYEFIKLHPDTEQALVAMLYIQEIMFQYACQQDKVEEYDAFIEAFPNAIQVNEARERAIVKAKKLETAELEKLFNKDNKDLERDNVAKALYDKKKKFEDDCYQCSDLAPSSNDNETQRVLKLFRLDRDYQVLRDVYGKYNSDNHVGDGKTDTINVYLNDIKVSINFVGLNKTIEKSTEKAIRQIIAAIDANHQTLVKGLQGISDKLCAKLDNIANKLDNIASVQKEVLTNLKSGFSELHKDLKKINSSIKETNKRMEVLHTLNKRLDNIAIQMQSMVLSNNSVPMPSLERINKYTENFKPDMPFVEFRGQSATPMNQLENIARRGCGLLKDVSFSFGSIKDKIIDLTTIWKTGYPNNSTSVGRFLGKLVEGSVRLVPGVGPFIAPVAGNLTQYFIDDLFIPYIAEMIDYVKEDIQLCIEIFEEYKERLIRFVKDMSDGKLPPALQEILNKKLETIKDMKEAVTVIRDNFIRLLKDVAEFFNLDPKVILYEICYLD